MIDVSDDLRHLLTDRRPHRVFDLWTIALTSGLTLYWTSADVDLTVADRTYRSEVHLSRGKCKLTAGLETATQSLTISTDTARETRINGIPLRQAIRAGLFDGAAVRLVWAYYDLDYPPGLIGTILRFTGAVGDIDAFASKATLTINSPLKRLDLEIPWKMYGAGCRFILGDADCGADVAARSQTGRVVEGSTTGQLVTDRADTDGTWIGATLAVTSGDDATFRRTVRTNRGGVLILKTPLPWSPLAGDAFTLLPGCDKTRAGCAKFANSARFGGMPYIPSPETAY